MHLNAVDAVILIALVIAVVNGSRRGFWLSLAQYLGLLIGVLVGAALAGPLLDLFGVTGSLKSVGAVLVLLIAGTAGSTAGYWVGRPIRLRLLVRPGRGRTDTVGGAIFSGLAVLAASWFLGLAFDRGPSPALARLIQRSTILRALDGIAPRPPRFLAGVEQILSGVRAPQVFSGLEPFFAPPLQIPSSADTAGIRAAAGVTVKVVGRGCGGIVYGSGFPVASGQILTNAHVVAGTHGTTIDTPDGRAFRAIVVIFDPDRDIAVLDVPDLPLGVPGEADADRGTQGAAIGYPGGRNENVSPAVVDSQVEAEGRDIYGQNLVRRQIWIIEADVQPGNSGGPLVDRDGHVIGVVFAASTSQPGQAYALTDAEAQPDIQAAQGRTQPVGTGQCAL